MNLTQIGFCLGRIRNILPPSYEYEFIDGIEDSEPAEGIDLVYPGPYLQYAGSAKNVDAATTYLEEIIEEEGPFDGIIGFSQGAAFAARLLLRHQERDPLTPPPFKMAVFFCASSLFYFKTTQEYEERMKTFAAIRLQVPTVHVIGSRDPHRPFGLDLTDLCDRRVRKVIEHKMGHEIPREKDVIEIVRISIEWAVRMSHIGG